MSISDGIMRMLLIVFIAVTARLALVLSSAPPTGLNYFKVEARGYAEGTVPCELF